MIVKPTELWVLGRPVRIVYDASMKDYGECDYDTRVLKIRAGLDHSEDRDTTLHELMHMLDHLGDTGMKERQVRVLATLLYATLVDNPTLIEWLMDQGSSQTPATQASSL
jgi:hypothetical protein